jgi:hypothetical protein
MQPPKQRNEVEWIREQVYDAEDVIYATEPYAGASVVRYTWQYYVEGELLGSGIGALYGISMLHAKQLFHKWNTYNCGWHYEYLEEKEVSA